MSTEATCSAAVWRWPSSMTDASDEAAAGAAAALPLHLRIPLIHGVNDRPEDQEAFLRFFRTLPPETVTVEILPYHEYGRDKWKQCGMTYTMTDGFVTPQTVRGFEEALRADGVTVIKT